jgi:LemA protein
MKNSSFLWIGLALLLLVGGCGGCSYNNSFVTKNVNVESAWAGVQTEYQRRADLIGNLVETVKGEKNFEQQTLTDITNARAKATSMQVDPTNLTPEKLQEIQAAQGQLGSALGRLLSVTENYPNLKANAAFAELRTSLEGTENRIKTARNKFNDGVKEYNTAISLLPGSLYAGVLGFKRRAFFEADAGSQKAPSVKF